MSNKLLCIYHANCADGFGAAMAVREAYGESNVDFYPGVYQNPPPDVTDRDVILVDFSYKKDVISEMLCKAKEILIIDHHESAVNEFKNFSPPSGSTFDCVFDMAHSGAVLTWKTLLPDEPVPKLLEYIEDRDLWRFQLPDSKEVNEAIFSYPYNFNVWDLYMHNDDLIYNLKVEGTALLRKKNKDIEELLKVTQRKFVIDNYVVPAANLPYTLASDAGHIMAKGHPFAACYWDTPEGRVFSLRSDSEGLNVAEIAAKFGGGGHKHAAGFRVQRVYADYFQDVTEVFPSKNGGI
ncbi:DHH family phosphoesterase [Candidatus Macondimonas diazotrophica]|uniref:Phosphohydrolase n=1 Tax=Candidatus Macondimonas diazotrophica TaxID=2305248 RepID=A0A4Z0F6T1_9GAMM|nr:DHH family phosphoesterase [Candidatus Macondimonas diazotrophica]TFZ81666.1 phosphohydrolase [Candidatus Macondimonas diazotrophica]